MRKNIGIVLAIIMSIALLCACSNSNNFQKSVTDNSTQITETAAALQDDKIDEVTTDNKEVADTTVKEKEKTTKQNKKETKPSSQKNNETTQNGKTENKKATTAKKVEKSENNKNNKSKLSAVTTSSTDAYAVTATATHLRSDKPTAKITSTTRVKIGVGKKSDKPTAKITSTTSSKKTCTITIECKSILDNMDDLKSGHEAYVPKNGIILSKYEATFNGKATVYDLLKKACDDNKIPYNAKTTIYSVYISGINNLDEFDCGGDSGWLYYVNGKMPNVSCDSIKLKDGDKVVFSYTCSYNK